MKDRVLPALNAEEENHTKEWNAPHITLLGLYCIPNLQNYKKVYLPCYWVPSLLEPQESTSKRKSRPAEFQL